MYLPSPSVIESTLGLPAVLALSGASTVDKIQPVFYVLHDLFFNIFFVYKSFAIKLMN